jgi:hypothetical protein
MLFVLAGVAAFQLALAAGAPWGEYAMGGAYPGAYPPPMRIAALVQIAIYGLVALVMLARAGLAGPARLRAVRWPAWVVVILFGAGALMNLASPSVSERLLWTPVTVALFLLSLRIALARG